MIPATAMMLHIHRPWSGRIPASPTGISAQTPM